MFLPPLGSPLNVSSPFANHLVAYFPLNEGGGKTATNLSPGPVKNATFNTPATSRYKVSQLGTCGHTEAQEMMAAPTSLDPVYPVSMGCWVRFDTGFISVNTLMAWGRANEELVLTQVSGSLWALTESAGGNVQATSTLVPVADVWYQVFGVWANATSRKIYVDGRLQGTDSSPKTPAGGSSSGIRFGQRWGVNQPLQGDLKNAGVWYRALSDSEIAYLYANPWAMLSRPNPTFGSQPPVSTSDIMLPQGRRGTGGSVYRIS